MTISQKPERTYVLTTLAASGHPPIRCAREVVMADQADHVERHSASVHDAADAMRALYAISATLAVAESCTGGLIGHLLTEVPGASQTFLGSAVVYANAAKQALLGVDEALLQAQGAVSEPVALAMAAGARRQYGSDVAIATSGIAGPDGGTAEKPVGTLCLAVSAADGQEAWTLHFPGLDRAAFKYAAARAALAAVRTWAERQG